MDKLLIKGAPGLRLTGEVRMSGAKNAVLPAIAASLLSSEEVRLTNVPRVKDVETILLIKKLLYEQKFTIAGARARLDNKAKPAPAQGPKQLAIEFDRAGRDELVAEIISELKSIRDILSVDD